MRRAKNFLDAALRTGDRKSWIFDRAESMADDKWRQRERDEKIEGYLPSPEESLPERYPGSCRPTGENSAMRR